MIRRERMDRFRLMYQHSKVTPLTIGLVAGAMSCPLSYADTATAPSAPPVPAPASTPASATLSFTANVAPTEPKPTTAVELGEVLQVLIDQVAQDPRIKSKVVVGQDGKFVMVAYGAVDDERQAAQLRNDLGRAMESTFSTFGKTVVNIAVSDKADSLEHAQEKKKAAKADQEAKDKIKATEDRVVTAVWPLIFTPETVGGTLPNSVASEAVERYKIDTLVTALNDRYGKKDAPVVQATRNALIMRATPKVVLQMKSDLTLLDSPGAQVQLDTWAVQMSGKGDSLDKVVEMINSRLYATREIMKKIQDDLVNATIENAHSITRLTGDRTITNGVEDYPNFVILDSLVKLDSELIALREQKEKFDHLGTEIEKLTAQIDTLTNPSQIEEKQRLEKIRASKQKEVKALTPRFPEVSFKEQLENKLKVRNNQVLKIKIAGVPRTPDPAEWESLQLLYMLDRFAAFDINPVRRLTMTEVLILLAAMEYRDRERALKTFENKAVEKSGWIEQAQKARVLGKEIKPASLSPVYERFAYILLPERGNETIGESFRVNIAQYLRAAWRYRMVESNLAERPAAEIMADAKLWRAPEQLSRQAAALDNLFAVAVGALSSDIQEKLLSPLVASINNTDPRLAGRSKGVALLGRTRMVVTSGLQTSLSPTLTGTVNVTTPAPITSAEIAGHAGAGDLKTLFENLSTPQLAALGIILNEPAPMYADIAPGVGLNVRPTVMPDGNSARLQVNARFGVNTKFPGVAETHAGLQTPQPFDAVQTHHISTDAIVGALDLFGLSSFNIDTRSPRTPFTVPILGRIPILGQIFRFPRSDTKLKHYSILLVNTVILPRTLDVMRFYGGGSYGTGNSANLHSAFLGNEYLDPLDPLDPQTSGSIRKPTDMLLIPERKQRFEKEAG